MCAATHDLFKNMSPEQKTALVSLYTIALLKESTEHTGTLIKELNELDNKDYSITDVEKKMQDLVKKYNLKGFNTLIPENDPPKKQQPTQRPQNWGWDDYDGY